MRKKCFYFLAITLLATMFITQGAAAGSYDSVYSAATFSTLVEYDKSELGTYEIRGFCASNDGKYLFGGCLQDDRRIIKIDASTGEVLGEYKDSEPGYGKGLATDDRGNLYIGIANAANDGAVGFAIVDVSTMKEINFVSTEISGKVGVNGVTVIKIGDKYYMYLIINYDTDRLYCYDVTDTANPVLKADFGQNSGYTDIQALTGNAECDANYLAVDSDGTIYLTAKIAAGTKGDSILKISADGKNITATAPFTEPYGIILHDGYLLVSTYNSADSVIYVINASDLSTVCEIGNMSDASKYSGVAIAGDKIYISDQGYGNGDRILVSNKLEFPVAETVPAETDAPVVEVAADNTADSTPVTKAAETVDIMSFSIIALAVSSALIISRRKK
jgi:Uncharacterized conserved protein